MAFNRGYEFIKNQYFGDVRDLFKYDLIQKIMKESPELRQFSFIPMLTENDGRSDGNHRIPDDIKTIRHRPGTQNLDLVEFLRRYNTIPLEEKNFTAIQRYFSGLKIPTTIYLSDLVFPENYFIHRERSNYFSNIPPENFDSALIFVDPDNGLEVKKPSKKHILYSEVMQLYERMSDDSVLMIYQHFPRVKHDVYRNLRVAELNEKTSAKTLWISDNEIIFFILAKKERNRKNLEKMLSSYSAEYQKCRSVCD